MVQTGLSGPLEDIKISLGDKINTGDVLFVIDNISASELHDLAKAEVSTRSKKVEIIEQLVSKGSDSEFRLLDERLALIDAQKRFEQAKRRLEFSYIKSPISGIVSKVNSQNIGQIVKEASVLAEIVPENNVLQIEGGVNPLTVSKAYQELVDLKIVEKRRGLGMFVTGPAKKQLLKIEKDKFLKGDWPAVLKKAEQLDIDLVELVNKG